MEWKRGGRREYKKRQERGQETGHTGWVWRLGVGPVSWEQTDSRRQKRKQRSILSELGSYPRGHRIGMAHGESQRRRRSKVGGDEAVVLFISFYSGLKKIYVQLCACLNVVCMCKYWTGTSELINQSIESCLYKGRRSKSRTSFPSLMGGVIQPREHQKQDRDKGTEK